MGSGNRMMEIQEEQDHKDVIEHLLENETLLEDVPLKEEDKVKDIAKLIIDKGLDSLSKKQIYNYKKHIEPKITGSQCEVCETIYTSLEDIQFLEDNGICGSCQHTKDSIMKD